MPSSDGALLAIFDHDGVLVDTLTLAPGGLARVRPAQRPAITAEFIHQTFGMTNPSILRLLLGDDDVRVRDRPPLGASRRSVTAKSPAGKIALMDGRPRDARCPYGRGVRLAIGSSGVRANLELTVRECGLDGRFAAIAALEDITRGKPDPQVFLVAAARSGVEPARSVVFEDAPVGIQAAKAAGMYAVGLTTSHPAAVLWDAGADEVVENLVGYDVPGLVGRLKDRHP